MPGRFAKDERALRAIEMADAGRACEFGRPAPSDTLLLRPIVGSCCEPCLVPLERCGRVGN